LRGPDYRLWGRRTSRGPGRGSVVGRFHCPQTGELTSTHQENLLAVDSLTRVTLGSLQGAVRGAHQRGSRSTTIPMSSPAHGVRTTRGTWMDGLTGSARCGTTVSRSGWWSRTIWTSHGLGSRWRRQASHASSL